MRCDQARERMSSLLDGELSGEESRALIAHAEDCPQCARYRDELGRLGSHLVLVREKAPRTLLHRVRASLAVETAAHLAPQANEPLQMGGIARFGSRLRPYVAQAAAVLVACILSIAATWWWVRAIDTRDALARDVVSAHVRSLLQDNAVQIASADTHTVKPWFAGRLEFAPVVKDLSAEGFRLIGGRVDYVGGRRVAALMYRRNLHQVTVFIWPASGETTAPVRPRLDGYNLVFWTRAGMTFWAISDLNEHELRDLQALL
jgi:anti-sigma factor RsiW